MGRTFGGLLPSRSFIEVPHHAGKVVLATTRLSMMVSASVFLGHGRGAQLAAPGEILLVRRCDIYRVEGASGYVVNLDVQPGYLSDKGLDENGLAAALVNAPGSNLVLLRLYRESRLNPLGPSAEAMGMLDRWLDTARRVGTQASGHWSARVRDYLAEHWSEGPALGVLAEVAGCHPVTVAKYFPTWFGSTQREYVRLLKTEHAVCELLRSDASVTDVAHRCGFSDHSHLTRTLRQLTGYTPVSLRRLRTLRG